MEFRTYKEALDWIAEGQAKYGKRAFTARPEYHAAYKQIAALAKSDGAKRVRRNRKTEKRVGGNVDLMAWSLKNA